jgi:hypothetical protein
MEEKFGPLEKSINFDINEDYIFQNKSRVQHFRPHEEILEHFK